MAGSVTAGSVCEAWGEGDGGGTGHGEEAWVVAFFDHGLVVEWYAGEG